MLQSPIFSSFYNFMIHYSVKLIVDIFGDRTSVRHSELFYPMILCICTIITIEIVKRMSQFAHVRSQPFIKMNIISKTYDYIQHHSYDFFQNISSGLITSKIRGIVEGYNVLWFTISSRILGPLLQSIISTIVIAFISIPLFITVTFLCLIFFPIMLTLSRNMAYFESRVSESKHHLLGLISDNIVNIFSILSFTRRKYELNKINKFMYYDHINNIIDKNENEMNFQKVISIICGLMISFSFLLIIYLRINNIITTGELVFLLSSIFSIIENIRKLTSEFGVLLIQFGDFQSAFSILDSSYQNRDKPELKSLRINNANIHFKNIVFSYNDKEVLLNKFNLKINGGEKIGIVGRSGVGKSTLVNLLLRFFEVKEGEILIDGQDISGVRLDSLRKKIAIIPQDVLLFNRTLKENISYGKENVTDEEIFEACKKANIHDFIQNLDNSYDTYVGERGVKLSGGQRQRIAIARAILKNAPILILDEATSSLDTQCEKYIQDSLNFLLKDLKITVISIAHRLSTLENMDRIIVLDKGRIVKETNDFRTIL